MIPIEVIFNNYPFDTDGTFSFGKWIKFKYTFAKKRYAVVKIGSDEKVLLTQAEGNSSIPVTAECVNKTPYLGVLTKHGDADKQTANKHQEMKNAFHPACINRSVL